VDQTFNSRRSPVKIFLFITDLANGIARNFDQPILGDRSRAADLSSEDDAIGCDERLDAATSLRVRRQIRVDYGVRNSVANLVGVTFGNRFAGKYEIAISQEIAFLVSLKRLRKSKAELMQSCGAVVKPDLAIQAAPLLLKAAIPQRPVPRRPAPWRDRTSGGARPGPRSDSRH
jgi:hypothetical protein